MNPTQNAAGAAESGRGRGASRSGLASRCRRFQESHQTFWRGPGGEGGDSGCLVCGRRRAECGELVTIVGPSGCGKSTLLRIIAGLKPHFPPTLGEVRVLGKPVKEPGPDRGLVDQRVLASAAPERDREHRLWIEAPRRGALGAPGPGAGMGEEGGAGRMREEVSSALSGGMQQRVAIAATLILEPRILLMDEPFGALDPGIRLRMQELLIKLWNERQETVFLVTHSVEEAVYLGDRVYVMAANPGRLVEVLKVPRPSEPPEESRRKPWFVDFCQALLAGSRRNLRRIRGSRSRRQAAHGRAGAKLSRRIPQEPASRGLGAADARAGFLSAQVLGLIAGATLYLLGWIYLPDVPFFRRWVDRRHEAARRRARSRSSPSLSSVGMPCCGPFRGRTGNATNRLAQVCTDIEAARADTRRPGWRSPRPTRASASSTN